MNYHVIMNEKERRVSMTLVYHLEEEMTKILKILGPDYEKYYFESEI